MLGALKFAFIWCVLIPLTVVSLLVVSLTASTLPVSEKRALSTVSLFIALAFAFLNIYYARSLYLLPCLTLIQDSGYNITGEKT